MSLRQKAAKGIVWSMIQKWGRAGITTLTFIILGRLLTPEAFGLVALATIFTDFVEIFLDQGTSAAIVQRSDLERAHLDTAFWISMAAGGMFALLGIGVSGWVAAFFDQPAVAPILQWLSLGFIINALSTTQLAILQRKLAFKSLAARSLTATTIGGAAGITAAFLGLGVWSLVIQNLVRGAAAAVILWQASDWRPGFNLSRQHYRELLTFGLSVTGNNALEVVVKRSDDLLIGYFLGPTLLGFYTIGYRLLLVIIRLVTEVINTVAFPTFSRLQEQPERMRNAFYKVTKYTALVAFPVFCGLAVLSPELIPALFGEKWLPSVPVMQVLSLIGILQAVMFFNASVIRAAGKPAWEFGIMVLNSALSVIGFLVAVRWGIVAVAASFVLVGYLIAPLSFAAVRKLIQVDPRRYVLQFAPPLIAALVMAAAILGLKYLLRGQALNLYVALAVYVGAGALAYGLALAALARPLLREVLDLARLVFPASKVRNVS